MRLCFLAPARYDGRFRKIEVRPARPGLQAENPGVISPCPTPAQAR
jgi:hypothetical protein